MSRSKSILLQVAFKEAVSATLGTQTSVKEKSKEFFQTLIDLHDEFSIPITDGGGGSNFNRGGSSGGSRSAPQLPEEVVTFADANSTTWYDFRAAKAAGSSKPGHPDFKTTDFKSSEWMFDKDSGQENATAIELAKAADQMASLAAPM